MIDVAALIMKKLYHIDTAIRASPVERCPMLNLLFLNVDLHILNQVLNDFNRTCLHGIEQ